MAVQQFKYLGTLYNIRVVNEVLRKVSDAYEKVEIYYCYDPPEIIETLRSEANISDGERGHLIRTRKDHT